MYIPGKFSIIIGLVAVALIPLIAFSQGGFGSNKVVESERQVGSFTRIASGGSANVRIHKSPGYRVVVSTNARLQDLFEARTINGLLSLGFKPGALIKGTTSLTVDVYMPELDDLTLSGSGKAVLMDKFTGKDLKTVTSGSGSIQGNISYDSMTASISGSGSVRLSGSCPQLGITVSGSGSFEGRDLASVMASAIISGSGSISLDVSNTLDAVVTGSGRIRYSGNPAVTTRITGSGTVRKTGG